MKKGSITLYLSLVLVVILSLICTALFSARSAAGRVVLASAAEQGMYSLFSRFDRTLLDDYGILAIDGGYGGSQLKLGSLQKEAEDVVEFLTGDSSDLTGPTNLMHLSSRKGEVTGYLLLTDSDGALLREQVLKALMGKKAASVLQDVKNQMSGQSSDWEKLEKEGDSIDAAGIEQEYDNLQQKGGEESGAGVSLKGNAATVKTMLCTAEESQNAVESSGTAVPETTENPIEIIRGIRKLGIVNLVLPKDRKVSAGTIGTDKVSSRTLQQGMGIVPVADASAGDKVLLLEYIMESFHDFTEAGKEESTGLQYQVEYAIGGKDSDAENLQAVLNRLLAIREASNYLFLLKDPVKQEEIHTAALSISTLIALPVAEPIVAEMLRLCWAFGESVLDLRELLKGGKIPLMKDSASWQLSLNMLTHLQDELTEQHSTEKGLDYQWYLRFLLAAQSERSLTESLMDLLEHQIRKTEGRKDFRLDNCLVSMKIKFRAKQDDLFLLEAERSYNYT